VRDLPPSFWFQYNIVPEKKTYQSNYLSYCRNARPRFSAFKKQTAGSYKVTAENPHSGMLMPHQSITVSLYRPIEK